MSDRELSRRTVRAAKAAWLAAGVLGMAFAAAGPLGAREAGGGTNAQPSQTVTAVLEYREVGFDFERSVLTVIPRSAVFKKEPALSRRNVVRGMLQVDGGAGNEMGFAWDRLAGKLYLDLNRNLDLTDDPAGVFSSGLEVGLNYQTFTNVHLPWRTPAGDRQALVDLNFYEFSGLTCQASIRSFWQGKVTLQGMEWQLGLLANPFESQAPLENGTLLLRPWAERNQPFSRDGSSPDTSSFPRKLFLGNHAYRLQCAEEGPATARKVRVQLTGEQAELGELKITGEFVRRVTLEGGPYLVVLDQPGAVVQVPTGRYGPARVALRKGGAEAGLDSRAPAATGRIAISAKTPAVLTVGGPLTNSMSVRRAGRKLALSYELLGAGGAYELATRDAMNPPEFTVYQGEKKVGSGKFQYG